MPKYSVIVPVYKVEKYIKQCIRSILEQTFTDFEVICVDDCGNDNSIRIIEKMAEKDDRITILHHDRNRGLSAARNTGLEIAKGEYVLFVDSDDWIEKNCLEIINDTFNKYNTDSVLFDGWTYNDKTHTRDSKPLLNNDFGYLDITPDFIEKGTDFAWIKAYKLSSIKEHNLTFPEGLTFEDGEFYFKFFSLYPRTFVLNNCLYNYRTRDGSIVTNAQKGIINLEDMYQIVKNIRKFYLDNNLYDKYKISVGMLLNSRINTCRSINKNYEKSLGMSEQLIEEFGGLKEFEEFIIDKMPLLTVIVPLDKSSEQTIQSLQKQNYTNLEILLVDKCTNKEITTSVQQYLAHDNRIKIINIENEQDAYGTGLNNANGKYILMLNSGDIINQDCLSKSVKALEDSRLNFVMFGTNIENSQSVQNKSENKNENSLEGIVEVDESLNLYNIFNAFNKIYNRSFLINNNIKFEGRKCFNDYEFVLKVLANSHTFFNINKSFYVPQKLESKVYNHDMIISDFKNVVENFYQYTKNSQLDVNKIIYAFITYKLNDLISMSFDYKELKTIIDSCKNFINFDNNSKKGE